MPTAEPQSFTRLADGTTLLRRADGSYEPVHSLTDHARLAALTDAEIERMSADDTDHPALDNAFWNAVDQQAANETITIRLDGDVLSYFRREGRGYHARINAVLRRYVDQATERR